MGKETKKAPTTVANKKAAPTATEPASKKASASATTAAKPVKKPTAVAKSVVAKPAASASAVSSSKKVKAVVTAAATSPAQKPTTAKVAATPAAAAKPADPAKAKKKHNRAAAKRKKARKLAKRRSTLLQPGGGVASSAANGGAAKKKPQEAGQKSQKKGDAKKGGNGASTSVSTAAAAEGSSGKEVASVESQKPLMTGELSFTRPQTDKRMTNRQKCLVLGSRSMSSRDRHLLLDFSNFLPHARSHQKLVSRTDVGSQIGELCDLHQCNSTMFIEGRKRETSFMWLGQAPNGPSIKFNLVNVHTADELRMTGNCLKYSRMMIHFDQPFDQLPHLRVAKALLQQVYNVPRYHPRSKPFIDHIMCFFYLDNRIWVRHYQFVHQTSPMSLTEIGPRFVLEPIIILNGLCRGAVMWRDVNAVAPSVLRRTRKELALQKMIRNESVSKQSEKHKKLNPAPQLDPLDAVFRDFLKPTPVDV